MENLRGVSRDLAAKSSGSRRQPGRDRRLRTFNREWYRRPDIHEAGLVDRKLGSVRLKFEN